MKEEIQGYYLNESKLAVCGERKKGRPCCAQTVKKVSSIPEELLGNRYCIFAMISNNNASRPELRKTLLLKATFKLAGSSCEAMVPVY